MELIELTTPSSENENIEHSVGQALENPVAYDVFLVRLNEYTKKPYSELAQNIPPYSSEHIDKTQHHYYPQIVSAIIISCSVLGTGVLAIGVFRIGIVWTLLICILVLSLMVIGYVSFINPIANSITERFLSI